MAELKDVVETILRDLIEARHLANKYSLAISREYRSSGELKGFGTPAVDIGSVRVDLKFVMEDPGDDDVTPAGRQLDTDEIYKLVKPLTLSSSALGHPSLVFKESSNTAANRNALASKLARLVQENTDPSTLKINQASFVKKASALLKPHMGKTANGRVVSSRTINTVLRRMVSKAEKELQEATTKLAETAIRKPRMIVDINRLKEVDAGVVAHISLDLDLSTMEYSEIDED